MGIHVGEKEDHEITWKRKLFKKQGDTTPIQICRSKNTKMQDYATWPLQLAIVENSASDSSSNYDLMFTKTKEIPVILREGRSRKWRRWGRVPIYQLFKKGRRKWLGRIQES